MSIYEALRYQTLGLITTPAGSVSIGEDHGLLSGLLDDDHMQYVHISTARTISAQHTISPAAPAAPWVLGANAQNQVVTGLLSDHVNKVVSAGDGIAVSGALTTGAGVTVTVDLSGTSGLEFSGGDLQIADTIAGAGLAISSKVLAVGAGDGITVNANDVALTTPGTLTVSTSNSSAGSHTHAVTSSSNPGAATSLLKSDASGYLQLTRIGLGVAPSYLLHLLGTTAPQARIAYDANNYFDIEVASSGNTTLQAISNGSGGSITLDADGSIILDPAGKMVRPANTYEVNLGMPNKKYLSLHCAELWVETLVAQETLATIGGRILVGPTTYLTADIDNTDTTIYCKHNNLAINDTVYAEGNGYVEFMLVTGGPTESAEIASNIGFETAGGGGADVFADWSETAATGAIAQDSANEHGGSYCAKLTPSGFDDTYIYQDITVTENTQYVLSWWQYGPGRAQIYDNTNAADIYVVASKNPGSAYRQYHIYFTSPESCVSIRVYFYASAAGGSPAPAYYDDVHVGLAQYSYTVTRNRDGSGANIWNAGDALFNTGNTGDGFMDIYSMRGVKDASEYGPTIAGNVRNSTTYNDWSEFWAIGNLNGLYDYGSDTYGAGFGKYANSNTWMSIDSTSGLRIMKRAAGVDAQIGRWAVDGVVTIGQVGSGLGNMYISSGDIIIRLNTTERMKLSSAGVLTINDSAGAAVFTLDASAGAEFTKPLTIGASGGIYQGTGTFASPTTGLKIYNDGGYGNIALYNSSNIAMWVDENGISFTGGTGNSNLIKWYESTDNILSIGSAVIVIPSTYTLAQITAGDSGSNPVQLNLSAVDGTDTALLSAYAGGGYSRWRFNVDYIDMAFSSPAPWVADIILGPTTIYSGLPIFVGDTSNANMTLGLTVNQGANDDELLAGKNSDVAHGMTDVAETDTYIRLLKISAADGGAWLDGFSEATVAMLVRGCGVTDNTSKSTSGAGYVELRAGKKSSAAVGAAGADANLVVIRNYTTTRFIFDAEGSAHADVEWASFDDYDDLAMLSDLETAMKDPVKSEFAEFLQYNHDALEDAGVVHFDRENPGHAMLNTTRLSMLLTGALRQLGGRVGKLENMLTKGM